MYSLAAMLPYFAAAGRGLCAKAVRLTLLSRAKYKCSFTSLESGFHTGGHSCHEWYGCWYNIRIEET